MNRCKTIAPAAMLAIFTGLAQQPKPTYSFKTVAATGTHIGGQTLPSNAAIEAIALNDASDVAFEASWTEFGRERTAVFTPKRVVAKSGDAIDGKILTSISANALTINGAGLVAFEAIYSDPSHASQIGIFIERKFSTALSTAGASQRFHAYRGWSRCFVGRRCGGPLRLPHQWPTKPDLKTILSQAIRLHDTQGTVRVTNNPTVPVSLPNPDVLLQGARRPQVQTKQTPQTAKAPVAAIRPCTAPEFPYPTAWNFGDTMSGPIASHIVEGPAKKQGLRIAFLWAH